MVKSDSLQNWVKNVKKFQSEKQQQTGREVERHSFCVEKSANCYDTDMDVNV